VRGGAEFAVDFMLVGVGKQLVEQVVGAAEFEDLVDGQERGQTFLPVHGELLIQAAAHETGLLAAGPKSLAAIL